MDADSPAYQSPEQAALRRLRSQPRLAVGSHAQVGFALKTVLHAQTAVVNRDGRLFFLLACEG